MSDEINYPIREPKIHRIYNDMIHELFPDLPSVESRILRCLGTGGGVTKPEIESIPLARILFWPPYQGSLLVPIQPIGSQRQRGLKWAPFLNIALSSSPSIALAESLVRANSSAKVIPRPTHLTSTSRHQQSICQRLFKFQIPFPRFRLDLTLSSRKAAAVD